MSNRSDVTTISGYADLDFFRQVSEMPLPTTELWHLFRRINLQMASYGPVLQPRPDDQMIFTFKIAFDIVWRKVPGWRIGSDLFQLGNWFANLSGSDGYMRHLFLLLASAIGKEIIAIGRFTTKLII